MDLSLALGRPVGSMSEREFIRWHSYARRKMLPQRRLELYLAQIAMLINRTMGGSVAELGDYLFDLEPDQPVRPPPDPADVDVERLRKVFNYKPRVKRHG